MLTVESARERRWAKPVTLVGTLSDMGPENIYLRISYPREQHTGNHQRRSHSRSHARRAARNYKFPSARDPGGHCCGHPPASTAFTSSCAIWTSVKRLTLQHGLSTWPHLSLRARETRLPLLTRSCWSSGGTAAGRCSGGAHSCCGGSRQPPRRNPPFRDRSGCQRMSRGPVGGRLGVRQVWLVEQDDGVRGAKDWNGALEIVPPLALSRTSIKNAMRSVRQPPYHTVTMYCSIFCNGTCSQNPEVAQVVHFACLSESCSCARSAFVYRRRLICGLSSCIIAGGPFSRVPMRRTPRSQSHHAARERIRAPPEPAHVKDVESRTSTKPRTAACPRYLPSRLLTWKSPATWSIRRTRRSQGTHDCGDKDNIGFPQNPELYFIENSNFPSRPLTPPPIYLTPDLQRQKNHACRTVSVRRYEVNTILTFPTTSSILQHYAADKTRCR